MKKSVVRFLVPFLLLFMVIGCEKRTVLLAGTNEEGDMRVEIAEIGDPGFPFGPTRCSARLYRNDVLAREENFEIKNDGKHASEENFELFWEKDEAMIRIHAEEEDKIIRLPFE